MLSEKLFFLFFFPLLPVQRTFVPSQRSFVTPILPTALQASLCTDDDANVDQLNKEHTESDPEPKLDLLRGIASLVKIFSYLACVDLGVIVGAPLKYLKVLELFEVLVVFGDFVAHGHPNDRRHDKVCKIATEALCSINFWNHERDKIGHESHREDHAEGDAAFAESVVACVAAKVSLRCVVGHLTRLAFSLALQRPGESRSVPSADLVAL